MSCILSRMSRENSTPPHDVIDALCAGFPAGTVSGAPKVRAMEIIDELETDKRGIYGGCIGYFSAAGDMDTCIVLRTAIVKDAMMHVQSGAGIVYDFEPGRRTAGMCQQGASPVPRRRGSGPLRGTRQARAVVERSPPLAPTRGAGARGRGLTALLSTPIFPACAGHRDAQSVSIRPAGAASHSACERMGFTSTVSASPALC